MLNRENEIVDSYLQNNRNRNKLVCGLLMKLYVGESLVK
jgi:hypothetical protein